MSKSPSLRRIQADIRVLALDPSDRYHAAPLENDMFEWYERLRFLSSVSLFKLTLPVALLVGILLFEAQKEQNLKAESIMVGFWYVGLYLLLLLNERVASKVDSD
jgi:hypothetical protein